MSGMGVLEMDDSLTGVSQFGGVILGHGHTI